MNLKQFSNFHRFIIVDDNECFNWVGCLSKNGYGRFNLNGKMVRTHRLSYKLYRGEIPQGLEIDHLCRNRKCCNPEHLEAVTRKENVLRGETGKHNRIKTHCKNGHEFNGKNTYIKLTGGRGCRECNRIRAIKYR